ncbi:MAG: hypothetical protein FJW83_07370 [Actinobacteria bacterium]|nr:hypothetical protein [Actinomycetota bacterium]
MTRPTAEQFQALFDPRGVVVAGASSHPGKFGFVSLHNVLAGGYEGRVFATNRDGGSILGIPTIPTLAELPDGAADLCMVCTPKGAAADVLRDGASRGVKAFFFTTAGYGESGPEGRRDEEDLVALARELGVLVAGPNGQGLVSTPARLCAQIVGPNPVRGRIGAASQSGNLVSSFMNLASSSGVGISRGISAGNAAMASVVDYVDWFSNDPETSVGLAYLEGVGEDGRGWFERMRSITTRMPVVVYKGGATAGGARAAASHTGSLASDDRVFDGACRQAGVTRAATVEEAFDTAASFATQPLPKGPRVVVVTTAGGWGVVTADAIAGSDLELVALPDDLRRSIDAKLPPRWSRSNPVDLAGAETRDTIPEVLELVAAHPDVDAVILLGVGIQSNQAKINKTGRFYPDHGLERIVDFHERQDARYARTAADVSVSTGKPVLVASELAVADPTNPGPATVRETGRYCYPTPQRAVRAMHHMWRHARRLERG